MGGFARGRAGRRTFALGALSAALLSGAAGPALAQSAGDGVAVGASGAAASLDVPGAVPHPSPLGGSALPMKGRDKGVELAQAGGVGGSAVPVTGSSKDAGASGSGEEITVTAERGRSAAALQRVPIAVTAFSGAALRARGIDGFRDLQFFVPGVTYSNGNFGGNNFAIRGIGISSVATSADSGVSVHTNDVYQLGTASLATAEYFDLDRIEVLRGPQSTLYGRNATGGVVNIITAKPVMNALTVSGDATYGEFNTAKGNLVFNAPLIADELALRVAYNYAHHDGYVENLFTGRDVDSQNLQQIRGSLRFTPSSKTTIDLIGQYGFEKDSFMRYPKQLCHRDPTGVLGCLPDALAYEPVNGTASFAGLASSTQTLSALYGLTSLLAPVGLNAGSVVPNDNLTISTDIDPQFRARTQFYMASVSQELTDWLSVTVLGNYSRSRQASLEQYDNLAGDDLSARLAQTTANMAARFGAIGRAYVSTFFTRPDGTLGLPLSIPGTGGVTAGPVDGKTVTYSTRATGTDFITGGGDQKTAEIRFNSHLSGPVDFMLAGFFIESKSDATYHVNANTLDYAGIVAGLLRYVTPKAAGGAGGAGPLLVLAPTEFKNDTRESNLRSKAVFGEVYWTAIPGELKFTGGLRWLEDEKHVVAQSTQLNVYAPLGTTPDQYDGLLALSPAFDADPSLAGRQLVSDQHAKFDQVTGRFVAEWTPQWEAADATLVYASYARGYKSGGFNPPVALSAVAVPATFRPEQIDAYEIGAKTRFADGGLLLNVTGYYYDYHGYQIADIVARTAVNANIDARIWGLEGEAQYRPDERWQFSLNVAHTDSRIGAASIVDQRNPTAGLANSVLVKDVTTGANCVIVMSALRNGVTPGQAGITGFAVPPEGAKALAAYNVPNVNFGSCSVAQFDSTSASYVPALGYTYVPNGGVRQSIEGNELPQSPRNTIAVGAQYALPFDNGMSLVLRGDYYWQSATFSRIVNGPADRIGSWDVLNLSVQLNAADDAWYAKLFGTNLLDGRALTGTYLSDASAGLFSNAFVQDPRVVGVTVGFKL